MTAELILLRGREWQGVSGEPGHDTGDFMARELSALGIEAERRTDVEMNALALQNALATALERSDVIAVLGGLGLDGITLPAVAQGLDIPLEEHRVSLMRITEHYARADVEPPVGWERQALLPQGAAVFQNLRGSAPGCAISAGSQCILMLPGEARELYPMVAEFVYPYLAEFCGEGVFCRTLRAFGIEGADAALLLDELLESENPVVAVYPHSGELLVRVTALAEEGEEPAQARCNAVAARIRERLGWQIYGADADTLPQTAVRALRHHKLRVATAEFGTSGELGMLLSDAPGSGAAAAQPLLVRDGREFVRLTGVVGEQDEPPESVLWRATTALAQRACMLVGTELGLAVVTEHAQDGAMLQACAALYADGQVWTRMLPAVAGPESTERTAHLVAMHALDLLRLYLDGPPDSLPDGEAVEVLSAPVEPQDERPKKRRGRQSDTLQPVLMGQMTPPGQGAPGADGKRRTNGLLAFFWPMRGDKKGDIARKVIMLAAAVVLLGALGYLGWSYAMGEERTVQASAESEALPSSEESSEDEASEESSALESEESSSSESVEEESTSTSSEDEAASTSSVSSVSSASSTASTSSASSASSTASTSSVASVASSSSSVASAASTSSSQSAVSESTSSEESTASSESKEESSESSEDFVAGKEVKATEGADRAESSEDSSSDDSYEDGSGGPIAMDETVTVNGSSMTAYDAICKITMNETGGTMRKEAIKAQAVAAYSRLVARGGSISGMGLRTANSTVKNAVKGVWGETVRHSGRTIDVFFGASTAGISNTAKEVWGGTMPGHTENVESPWDISAPGYEYTKKMSRDDVIDRVYNAFGVDLTDVSDDEWFTVDSYTGGGYNGNMTVGGTKRTTGRYLRENVLNLRSACFEWEFDGDNVLFTTYGYGHGVGLSQQGANGMAGEGSGYREILEHYYAGCTVG